MDFEEDLPSYATALSKRRGVPWAILAPYLPHQDYATLTRVDRSASQIFTRLVWQQPNSYFLNPHRSLVKGFFEFFDTVAPHPDTLTIENRSSNRRNSSKWDVIVRGHVRNLVRSLDLTSLNEGGLYADPGKVWLVTLLEALPSLKVLRLDGREWVDASSLTALAKDFEGRGREAPYKLELLSLAGCVNATSQSLMSIFGPNTRFKALRVLDLSGLKVFAGAGGAKDGTLARSLDGRTALPLLKIVKLRGCNIDDFVLSILAKGWGRSVESWDVRDNLGIGLEGVRALLEYCFAPPAYLGEKNPSQTQSSISSSLPSFESVVNNEDIDRDDLSILSRRLLPPNSTLGGKSQNGINGITRLKISGTGITASDAVDLLLTTRLTHLDVGSFIGGSFNLPREPQSDSGDVIVIPGLDELAGLFAEVSFPSILQYLRVDHRLLVAISARTTREDFHDSWIPASLRTLVLTDIPSKPSPPPTISLSSSLSQQSTTAIVTGWQTIINDLAIALRKSKLKTLICEISSSTTTLPPKAITTNNNGNQSSTGSTAAAKPQPKRKPSFGDKEASKFRQTMSKDFSFFNHDDEQPEEASSSPPSSDSFSSTDSSPVSNSTRGQTSIVGGSNNKDLDEKVGFLYHLREWRLRDKGTDREWPGSVQIVRV